MRYFLTVIILLTLSSNLFSAIPAGYYDPASGQSGYTLKTTLHNIIDGHSSVSYNSLHNYFPDTDRDYYYENDGSVLDMYSENPSGTDPYNYNWSSGEQCGTYSFENDCYNREHSFPASWFNDNSPMYSDLFHLYPTDGYVNGQRGSYPFGEVSSPSWTSMNGSKKGSCSYPGYTGTVFEPIDEFKGDFARTYFYMATRYEDVITGWNSVILDGSSDQVYENWYLNMMLEWHADDPVSTKEIDRNDAVYGIQNNRNPFIDHPEYVGYIWGGETPGLGTPVATSATNITMASFSANWNAAASATGYELDVSINSDFSSFVTGYNDLDVSNVTTYSVTGLSAETDYYYRVRAYNTTETSSSSNTISLTTGSEGGSHWTESFENPQQSFSSYTTGTITFDSGDWYFVSGLNESLANTGSIAVRLNDDTVGASMRTPSINTVGSVSFYFRELNSGGGTFSLEKSYNDVDWTEVTTQSFSGNTYTQFNYDVDDSASSIYLRVVSDDQAGHLIIDDFQVTSYTGGSAPSAPVATSASDITTTSFTANWNTSATATSYRLDVATDNLFTSLIGGYNDLSVIGTSQSVSGLTASTNYYYRVRGVNSYGTSGNSNTITTATDSAPPLSAPTAIAATNVSSASFSANWNSVSGATGYELDVATDNGFNSFVTGFNDLDVSNVTTYSVTGLSAETDYYYRVRAYNTTETSSSSNTVSLTTGSVGGSHWTESFENPQGTWSSYTTGTITFDSGDWYFVSGLNESLANTGSIAVRLNDDTVGASMRTPSINTVGSVSFYYRELNSGGGTFSLEKSYNDADWTEVTTQSFSGNTYTQFNYDVDDSASSIYLRVVSDDQAGHLIIDDFQVTSYTGGSAPSAPVATSASDITTTSFTANWNTSATATSYRLDVSTNNTFTAMVSGYNDLTISGTSQSVTGLSASTDYYYRVRAVNAYGTSGNSNTIFTITSQQSGGAASVIISQLCDPSSNYEINRFIEITNVGGSTQDLTGWSVVAVGNGSDIFTWNLSGTISPGQSLVCGDDGATGIVVNFAQADWSTSNSTWNGKADDGAKLNDSSKGLIDQIIATGTLFENSSLDRNQSVLEPSATSDESQWTATSVTNASEAGAGSHDYDNPLPVTLNSFTATYTNAALLNWTTQSELNNSHWNVYRSWSENFGQAEIANYEQINGAGTSFVPNNYEFIDPTQLDTEHTYFYWIESVSFAGETELHGPISLHTIPHYDNPQSPEVEKIYGLHKNYPNPFNPITKISFLLPDDALGQVIIYNIHGQKIKEFEPKNYQSETIYQVTWNGKNMNGNDVGSGIYFYQLKTKDQIFTKRMLLLK